MDGWTDMTKVIKAIRDCANAPKMDLNQNKKPGFSDMGFCECGYSTDIHSFVYQRSSN
jgi:hypothetical protein